VQHSGGRLPDNLTVVRADDRGQLSPQPSRRREVQLHGTTRRHPQLRRSSTQETDRVELRGVGFAPRCRGVGEERKVVAEEFDRDLADVTAGASRHVGQPQVVLGGRLGSPPRRCAAVGHGHPLPERLRRPNPVRVETSALPMPILPVVGNLFLAT
jgi:hypothetical protein